jgi:hypothetical protein
LISALGLVGMAALPLNVLKNAQSSYFRSIASVMALDFEERLWLATVAPAFADTSVTGCPDPIIVAQDMVGARPWGEQPPGGWDTYDVRIPGVQLAANNPAPVFDTNGRWVQATLVIRWTESRFNEAEQFQFTLRVPCAVEANENS